MLTRTLTLLVLALLTGQYLNAQVTTSSISGTAKAANGEPLVGASVVATHVPTGTVYRSLTRAGGRFDLPNVAPGGPYTVQLSYVGYGEFTRTDIMVPLGETFNVPAELSSTNQQLSEVVVSTTARGATEKTGASTNFSRRQLQVTPNISRSITALTRITPQANGNSFAGMNYRYNNITVDGALFNNNFGRSGDGQIPGGGVSAISIDALDQIQVNISPYDVRQAGFVGAGINAVTRRGTNTVTGTAYGFYRNQNFNGEKVKGQTVANTKRSTKIYGLSVGAPIIKNKLFFFGNVEREQSTVPGQTWLASRPSASGNVTPVLASDLDALAQHLRSTYSYDPGPYEGYDFATENFKFVTRLDWNVTDNHRLTLRYTQSNTDDDDRVNATSGPSGATRISNSRRGSSSGGLAFSGANFKNSTKVKSAVMELNSSLTNKITNQLIATYTRVQPERVPPGNVSFVDIMSGASTVYTSFGTDLFSFENKIDDKAFNIADNVTINLNKHTVTGGISYDYLAFENYFSDAGGPSYYRYSSLQNFLTNQAPSYFAITYSYQKDRTNIPPAAANFGQLGLYVQDAWAANPKFKLTYGLRVDKPLYTYDAPENPALAAVVFKNENGENEQFDVSQWPKSKLLFSPRAGFNWDVTGNKKVVIRGGTGIFTGRIPFIWLVNQVADNGVLRSIYQTSDPVVLAGIRYSTDRTEHIDKVPPATAGASIPAGRPQYSATAADFKMPQVWRTNIAYDNKFADNFMFTLEAIFTKTINNVYFRNANLGAANGVLNNKGDQRPFYNTRLNDNITSVIVMDNMNKGYTASFTGQLQKTFSKNWEGSLAYTYTLAQDVNMGTSDRASSSWYLNNIVQNPNDPELGYSNFSVPHRVVIGGSYRFNYAADKLATTIGLYYSGSAQERFHYRYNNDVNGDGQTNDLIFIPADPSQITFVEGLKVGTKTFTAQQQSDAFFRFIENDPYLKKNKGQYMERYGAQLPWVNNLDLRILQDFAFNAAKRKHTFQLSVDVVNFLNLLNDDWGTRSVYTFGSFSDQALLGIPTSGSSSNNTGNEAFNRNTPKFTFNPEGPAKGYQPDYSIFSTWGIQLGLRYIF